VIAPEDHLADVRRALEGEYGERVGSGAGGPSQDIVVLTPRGSKGLEFDGVTIVEPQLMLDSASSRWETSTSP
jgi:superfamily I DNA/RNA helicase